MIFFFLRKSSWTKPKRLVFVYSTEESVDQPKLLESRDLRLVHSVSLKQRPALGTSTPLNKCGMNVELYINPPLGFQESGK